MDPVRAFHHLSSQLQILYKQSVITFLFPVITAPAVCLLWWDIGDRNRLLVWTITIILYSVLRYVLLRSQNRSGITPENAGKRLELFIAGAFISGLLWGSAAIILVPYDPAGIIEFTVYNSLTMLIVCGLVAGAVVNYSVNRWVALFFAFPALVPPALYLILLGDKYNSALGGFVFLFFLFIAFSSLYLNRQFSRYIDTEFTMIELTEKLRRVQADNRRAARPAA